MSAVPQDRLVTESVIRVRYAETDAMGIVYHTNYLVWFEVGRGDLSRQMGADYRRWEQDGFALPVIEVSCRYLSPARYGDLVVVSTWAEDVRSRQVTFGYEIRMQDTGRVLVTGHTVHLCVGRDGHPVQIPAAWRAAMSTRS